MTSQLLIFLIVYTIFTKVTCESSTDWHYTGENVALHKLTEQTPGTENIYYGNLSVDGNSDSNLGLGSCSHTSGSPWGNDVPIASWKVFLGGMFPVTGIIIVNRDILHKRLKNFVIYGSQDLEQLYPISWKQDNTWLVIYNDTGKNAYANDTIHIPLDGDVNYSKIAVNLPKHQGDPDNGVSYLTLCEVEVYAAQRKCDAIHIEISNGYVNVHGNTGRLVNNQYTVGTVLVVKCIGSFLLNGSLFVKCMSSGEYNSTFPTCIDACRGFQKSTHVSDVIPDLLLYNANTAVEIRCTDGYKTNMTNPVYCLSGGKWDSPIPTCYPIKCPNLHNPVNGKYMMVRSNTVPHIDSDLGLEARVVCDTGYENKSNKTRICQLNETWSGQEQICMPVLCNHPGNITNGAYVFKNDSKAFFTTHFSYNTVLKSSCNNGYNVSGQAERACNSDKTWSGGEPTCDIVTCDFPGHFENGKYMIRDMKLTGKATDRTYFSGKVNFSIEIQAICVRGFILNSKEFVRRCSSHGTWTGKFPVCDHVICEWPLSISGGYYKASRNKTNEGMPYNTTVTAFCQGNYKLSAANQIIRCNESAQWDKEPAKCIFFEEQTSTDAGLIGGLSTTAIVLLIVTILAFFLYRRYRRKASQNNKASPVHFSHLHGNGNDSDRSTITPAYDYATPSTVKASRSTDNSKPSEVYSTVVKDETMMPSCASSETLQSDKEYYSFSETDKLPATAVKVTDLPDLILTGDDAKKKFQREFESLPQGMVGVHREALKLNNRGKNRYKNLYAYDDTRVVLDTEDGSESKSDYINACYVHGFNKTRKYIASQGPTTEILNDFWRMIWQTQCSKIVMLTRLVEEGKVKCEQYWPDNGRHTYDRIQVEIENTERFSQFVIRTLKVQKDNSPRRTVVQFHFTAWPDRGVPKYASSLVQFLSKVRYSPSTGKGPVVVHCSAGVGRTGTFIALDNVTEQGKALWYVDVAGVVEAMRKQRVSSVQTLDQYIFVYHAVVETLMLSSAAIPSGKFPEAFQGLLKTDTRTRRKKIYLEFETLKKMSPVAEENEYISSKLILNRRKNRYSNVLPIEEYMPTLTKADGSEETEYINAVFLPSYKEKKAFIITQTPLESTIEEFWRLVWEHDIHTLVMMNSLKEMTESEVYWPNVNETVTLGNIVISNDGIREMNGHTVLKFSAKKFLSTRRIRLLQCKGWKSDKTLPESPDILLSAMELVQSWQQQTGNHTVLVHCMNGVDKSGLFCVISAVIERLKIEQDVAITHVIEEMRNAREQIIPSVEQYQFCHEAVLAFIKLYDTYSNFTG